MYNNNKNKVESNLTIEILSKYYVVVGNYFFFCLGKCVMHKDCGTLSTLADAVAWARQTSIVKSVRTASRKYPWRIKIEKVVNLKNKKRVFFFFFFALGTDKMWPTPSQFGKAHNLFLLSQAKVCGWVCSKERSVYFRSWSVDRYYFYCYIIHLQLYIVGQRLQR